MSEYHGDFTFNKFDINNIKDYDNLDIKIINSILNNNKSNNSIDIFLDRLYYFMDILSDDEFNKLLIDISTNNLKDIIQLVKKHELYIVV
jgi:hypothetical protein